MTWRKAGPRSSWRLAVLITTPMIGAPAPGAGQEPVTAFVHVNVVPMDREQVLEDQTVVVQGRTIVALGPASRTPAPRSAALIDGHGQYLLPGLADMHTHLLWWQMKDGVLTGSGSPVGDEAVSGDSLAIERMLALFAAHGVTTIRNMDYFGAGSEPAAQTAPLLRWRARAAAGERWAPRIYTSGNWYVDPSLSVAENVTAYKAAGYDFVKPYWEPRPLLDSLVEAAAHVGLPVAGHLPVDLHAFGLAHRYKSIEHLMEFPAAMYGRGNPADTLQLPALVDATRQAGVWICPTEFKVETLDFGLDSLGYRRTLPTEWRDRGGPGPIPPSHHFDSTSWSAEQLQAMRESPLGEGMTDFLDGRQTIRLRRRLIKALQDAGVGLLLGVDAADEGAARRGLVPGLGVHHELQALVWSGLTPYQALATGTINVAKYFGTEDSTGTVAVGKRADLVLLRADPLEDIRNTSKIAGVMIGGRWRAQVQLEREMAGYAQTDTSMHAWFQ